MQKRNRFLYLILVFATIGLGLLSRTSFTPQFIYPYIGDALYALMVFFGIAFIFPKFDAAKILFISIGICFLIEILQLSTMHTLVAIRETRIGALILGQGFLWSDLVCYVVGAFFGYIFERLLKRS